MCNIKVVLWVCNLVFFDMFSQLLEKCVDYVFEDWLVIVEFNWMFINNGEKFLYVLFYFLVKLVIIVSLCKDYFNVWQLLDKFDSYIYDIQCDGCFNFVMVVGWISMDINGDGIVDWIISV